MIKASKLAEAQHYFNRYVEVNSMLEFLKTYKGQVNIQCGELGYGSYNCNISMKCSGSEKLIEALELESKMLFNTFEILGVEIDE